MFSSKYIIIAFVILYCLWCCDNKVEEKRTSTKKWYYENGNIKKVQEYVDSVEHGTYLFYYPDGTLQDSAQISEGKLHGKRYEFHENGQLHILTSYINDRYRSSKEYRPDGTLKFYRAYNYTEDLMFLFHYDSFGKPVKYDGDIIYSWVMEEQYPLGEEFNIELLVADPPNTQTKLQVSAWNVAEKKVESEQTYSPDHFNRVIYSRTQNPDQDLHILHVANMYDTVLQKTYVDTLVITVSREGETSHSAQLPY